MATKPGRHGDTKQDQSRGIGGSKACTHHRKHTLQPLKSPKHPSLQPCIRCDPKLCSLPQTLVWGLDSNPQTLRAQPHTKQQPFLNCTTTTPHQGTGHPHLTAHSLGPSARE